MQEQGNEPGTGGVPEPIPLVTIGWRSISETIDAGFEPFVDPPHREVRVMLSRMTMPPTPPTCHRRWQLMNDGRLVAFDPLRVMAPTQLVELQQLSVRVRNEALKLLEGLMMMPTDLIVGHATQMYAVRRDDLTRLAKALPRPVKPRVVAEALLPVTFDRSDVAPSDARVNYEYFEYDGELRPVRATLPVRDLPPVVITWSERVTLVLPGVPEHSPLAGWQTPETKMVEQIYDGFIRWVASQRD